MRVALNNRIDDMVARVCIHDLAAELRDAGVQATVNDWSNYEAYDAVVLRGADKATVEDIAKARAQNRNIRVFVADPKQSSAEYIRAAQLADVLMVSSLEQQEAFFRLNRNILIHYMFPRLDLAGASRAASAADRTVIGYHGNRVHIEAMTDGAQQALSALGKVHPLALHLIYNMTSTGAAKHGLPDPDLVPTRHIQWSWDCYSKNFVDFDIGIVPNLLPVGDKQRALGEARVPHLDVNYEPFDFLLRFKASSNPGRIYPFVMANVPVVAEFSPSASAFLRHGESGFLVMSSAGWYEAVDTLVRDPKLRTSFANSARAPFEKELRERAAKFIAAADGSLKRLPALELDRASIDQELALFGRSTLRRVVSGIWDRASRRKTK